MENKKTNISEKEESEKKLFDSGKMEALVHSDNKLLNQYEKMVEKGEKYYGFHYNENILVALFHTYVLNSPKYFEKYKMAVSKKKKRRDKSGINQLDKEFKKKREMQAKREEEILQNKQNMEIENNKESNVNETSDSSSSGQYSTPCAWSKDGKPKQKPMIPGSTIIMNEANYLIDPSGFKKYFDFLNESELDVSDKKDFISKNSEAYGNETNNMNKENIDIIYNDIKNKKIDEKAVSQKQQQFMGIVRGIQTGKINPNDASPETVKVAKEMKKNDVKDFASTKHDNLPEKISEDYSDTAQYLIQSSLKKLPLNDLLKWSEFNVLHSDTDPEFKIETYIKSKNIKLDTLKDIVEYYLYENLGFDGSIQTTEQEILVDLLDELNNILSPESKEEVNNKENSDFDEYKVEESIKDKKLGEIGTPEHYEKWFDDLELPNKYSDDENLMKYKRSYNISDEDITELKNLITGIDNYDLSGINEDSMIEPKDDTIAISGNDSTSMKMKEPITTGSNNIDTGINSTTGSKPYGKFDTLDDKSLTESKKINQKDYKFYLLNKKTNKIDTGWEFKEDANDAKNDRNVPSDFAVYTKQYLISKNLNPDDNKSWLNETINNINKNKINKMDELDKINEELNNFKTYMDELMNLSEDRKPSALVLLDRLKASNDKNFNSDFKESGTGEIVKLEDALQTKKDTTIVDDKPFENGEKIEEEELNKTKGEALKNVGDSANENGDEIIKRNLTKDEEEKIDSLRGGLHTFKFDTKPNEKYEKRMKEQMLDFYEKRNKYLKANDKSTMDMYQKNQPVTIQKESYVNAKYKDELNKTKFIGFDLNEAKEIKEKNENLFELFFDGLGNKYDNFCNVNESIANALEQKSYYINENNEIFYIKKNSLLNESNEKIITSDLLNENINKMKTLFNYNPNKFVETKNIKTNRGF